MRSAVVAFAAIVLNACVPTPEYYSIPPQHNPATVGMNPAAMPSAATVGEMFVSNAPNAEQYIVRDIRGLEGEWRWTLAEPELRFHMPSGELHRKFKLDIGVNDRTFRDTGPLRVLILINSKRLDEAVFQNFGDHVYEKIVPPAFLLPGTENRVAMKVLNPWQASEPGVRLGFVLRAAGFVSQ